MKRIEIFNGTNTYMFPNSTLATPEAIRESCPAIDAFPHILTIVGNTCVAIENLSVMREFYDIDPDLTDAEAAAAIEVIANTPTPAPPPDATERIAAALEYQNLLSMEG